MGSSRKRCQKQSGSKKEIASNFACTGDIVAADPKGVPAEAEDARALESHAPRKPQPPSRLPASPPQPSRRKGCGTNGGGGASCRNVGLKPDQNEVIAAIDSLYSDQLKPFGRILRKRVAEKAIQEVETAKDGTAVNTFGAAAAAIAARLEMAPQGSPRGDESQDLPDVDIRHLKQVCDDIDSLDVEPEEGGDWSATFTGRPEPFVNVYSPSDDYSQELWDAAARYFENLEGDEMFLPGGRYSCAQALVRRKLSFLAECSLGQVCHVVQLAISQKKLLGYSNGAVVPYMHSQSMMKEQRAREQQPCGSVGDVPQGEPGSPDALPNASGTASQPLPLASLEQARTVLRELLEGGTEQGPAMLPLSNVKRLFRSRYRMELSETFLGHSKLSELLQDDKFIDVCAVQLQGHGYTVVQAEGATSKSENRVAAPPELPLLSRHAALGPLASSSIHGDASYQPQPKPFCADDPLDSSAFDAAMMGAEGVSFPAPTPTPAEVYMHHAAMSFAAACTLPPVYPPYVDGPVPFGCGADVPLFNPLVPPFSAGNVWPGTNFDMSPQPSSGSTYMNAYPHTPALSPEAVRRRRPVSTPGDVGSESCFLDAQGIAGGGGDITDRTAEPPAPSSVSTSAAGVCVSSGPCDRGACAMSLGSFAQERERASADDNNANAPMKIEIRGYKSEVFSPSAPSAGARSAGNHALSPTPGAGRSPYVVAAVNDSPGLASKPSGGLVLSHVATTEANGSTSDTSGASERTPQLRAFCADEPLCFEDAGVFVDEFGGVPASPNVADLALPTPEPTSPYERSPWLGRRRSSSLPKSDAFVQSGVGGLFHNVDFNGPTSPTPASASMSTRSPAAYAEPAFLVPPTPDFFGSSSPVSIYYQGGQSFASVDSADTGRPLLRLSDHLPD